MTLSVPYQVWLIKGLANSAPIKVAYEPRQFAQKIRKLKNQLSAVCGLNETAHEWQFLKAVGTS